MDDERIIKLREALAGLGIIRVYVDAHGRVRAVFANGDEYTASGIAEWPADAAPRAEAAEKRLYTVEVGNEVVVLARSADEAEHIVRMNMREVLEQAELLNRPCEMAHMPDGWDETSLPYGGDYTDHTDRTVGDLIEAGAAPRYSLHLKQLRREAGE